MCHPSLLHHPSHVTTELPPLFATYHTLPFIVPIHQETGQESASAHGERGEPSEDRPRGLHHRPDLRAQVSFKPLIDILNLHTCTHGSNVYSLLPELILLLCCP